MKNQDSRKQPSGRPRTHGITALRRSVEGLGNRVVSRRYKVGRALWKWRAELLDDLGGVENVSTQELALLEEAVKTKLMLDSVDAWLLQQKTLVNKRTRGVLPAVRDRQSLVSTLRGLLGDLGLKRRGRTEPSLGEYLAGRPTGGSAKSAKSLLPSQERPEARHEPQSSLYDDTVRSGDEDQCPVADGEEVTT